MPPIDALPIRDWGAPPDAVMAAAELRAWGPPSHASPGYSGNGQKPPLASSMQKLIVFSGGSSCPE
jgi:hypothetical protein